jgi:hypothetical protein
MTTGQTSNPAHGSPVRVRSHAFRNPRPTAPSTQPADWAATRRPPRWSGVELWPRGSRRVPRKPQDADQFHRHRRTATAAKALRDWCADAFTTIPRRCNGSCRGVGERGAGGVGVACRGRDGRGDADPAPGNGNGKGGRRREVGMDEWGSEQLRVAERPGGAAGRAAVLHHRRAHTGATVAEQICHRRRSARDRDDRAPGSDPARTPLPAPDPGHFSTGTAGSFFNRNRHAGGAIARTYGRATSQQPVDAGSSTSAAVRSRELPLWT